MREITIQIQSMQQKSVNTKNGMSNLLKVLGTDNVTYTAWAGPWNAAWRPGMVINVEVERNGNYNNIKSPPKPQGQPIGAPAMMGGSSAQMDMLINVLIDLTKVVKDLVKQNTAPNAAPIEGEPSWLTEEPS